MINLTDFSFWKVGDYFNLSKFMISNNFQKKILNS